MRALLRPGHLGVGSCCACAGCCGGSSCDSCGEEDWTGFTVDDPVDAGAWPGVGDADRCDWYVLEGQEPPVVILGSGATPRMLINDPAETDCGISQFLGSGSTVGEDGATFLFEAELAAHTAGTDVTFALTGGVLGAPSSVPWMRLVNDGADVTVEWYDPDAAAVDSDSITGGAVAAYTFAIVLNGLSLGYFVNGAQVSPTFLVADFTTLLTNIGTDGLSLEVEMHSDTPADVSPRVGLVASSCEAVELEVPA